MPVNAMARQLNPVKGVRVNQADRSENTHREPPVDRRSSLQTAVAAVVRAVLAIVIAGASVLVALGAWSFGAILVGSWLGRGFDATTDLTLAEQLVTYGLAWATALLIIVPGAVLAIRLFTRK